MAARAATTKTAKSGRSRPKSPKASAKETRRHKPRRAGPPHVALIVETSLAYGRGLLHGIGRYIRENGPWSVYVDQRSLYDPSPPWLKAWTGDGIISRASSPQIAKLIVDTGVPAVDLNEEVMGLGLPLIYNDHQMIGQLAAEHLLERGFTQFAFLGYEGLEWSNRRQAGFQHAVAAQGYPSDVYNFPVKWKPGGAPPNWEDEMDSLYTWLHRLPKPVGIMACNDFRAVQLIDACRRAQVAVPEQAAVIGVDNEDVACELCNPPVTSVVPDSQRIGYEAARLLDLLMKGQPAAMQEQYVPPRGIITRRSTDITAISDPVVAEAMHFIRGHACDGIGVEDVVIETGVSRSVLQRRFRATVGRSIHDLITNVRLERVKQLLLESQLSLAQIADRAGFNHTEYLCTVFKQKTGQTITAFRQMHLQEGMDKFEAGL